MPKINLLVFWGCPTYRTEPTVVESGMDALLREAVRSILGRAGRTNRFERLLVVTNDLQLAELVATQAEVVTAPMEGEVFHFGQTLRRVIEQTGIGPDEAIVYFGAGAGSLLNEGEWQALLDTVQNFPNTVTANNYFSADLVGWQPVRAIFELPANSLGDGDNNLAWVLCRQAGLTWRTFLPDNTRTFGTQFDMDTPSDAAILKLWLNRQPDDEWPQLRQFLQTATVFDTLPTDRILAALSEFSSEVLVSGRISGQTHRLLESKSWSQTRVLSEERGMRASGREEAGQVVSLLGFLLESTEPHRFFQEFLTRSCRAAILDTRVLFSHLQLKPSRRDRFNSDALQPEYIHEPRVRAFTQAALEANYKWKLPVLLGGHTVVSGGLLLLLDLIPPKPYD